MSKKVAAPSAGAVAEIANIQEDKPESQITLHWNCAADL
jgi:hypothetical protein